MYTRRIGLSERGEPIPILAGGKLTGKAVGFDLGVLDVQTADVAGSPGENFAVARVRKEMMGRSYVGAVVTNRQGGGRTNRAAGADGRLVLGKYLSVVGLVAAASDVAVPGTRWATQAGAEWESDLVDAAVSYVNIDEGFTPGVGFVQRHDRMIGATVSLKPRPGGRLVRQVEIRPNAVVFHDRRGVLQSGFGGVEVSPLFQSGDLLYLKVETEAQYLPDPFEISPGIVLTPGHYRWTQGEVRFTTFDGRRWAGKAEANLGHFYTGKRGSCEFEVQFRPGKNFSVEAEYELNDVDLLEGSFNTHLLGVKTNVSFTNTLFASAYVQYNNTGGLAALQVRLNYIFRSIDNFYLVYTRRTTRAESTQIGRIDRWWRS